MAALSVSKMEILKADYLDILLVGEKVDGKVERKARKLVGMKAVEMVDLKAFDCKCSQKN